MLKALDTARRVHNSGQAHGVLTHAAAMAFFLLFSFPALIVVLVVLAGLLPVDRVLDASDASLVKEIRTRLETGLPHESAEVVWEFVDTYFADAESAVSAVFEKRPVKEASGALATRSGPAAVLARAVRNRQRWMLVFAFAFVLWSASGATRAAMEAMDNIHEVGHCSFLRRAAKSIVLTVGMGAGTLLVLAILPFGNLVARSVTAHRELGHGWLVAWQVVNWLIGVGLLYLLVAHFQMHAATKQLSYRDVRSGTAVTVVAWIALSFGLKVWTEHGWDSFGATYGAMAGLVVLLLWAYFTSAALLVGTEVVALTRKRNREQGRRGGGRKRKRKRKKRGSVVLRALLPLRPRRGRAA